MKRKHDGASPFCWCRPKLERPCRICAGDEDLSGLALPCWKCHGRGMVEGHPDESNLLIIHNDEEDEISPAGSGPSATVLLILIVIIVLVAAAYLALVTGGGR